VSRPTLSVVVRTYNRAEYLRQALHSIQHQTLVPDEVIVVDDGSTDETPDVAAEYAVRYTRRPHTGNPPAVLNAGLRAATGDLVGLLDSDDVWLPRKLEQQRALLMADPRTGFAYGNARLLLPDGQQSAPVLHPTQIVRGDVLPVVVRSMCVHPSTLLIRRALLERIGPLDETERVNEDLFLVLKLAREMHAACVADPIALIRRHPEQVSTAHGLLAYTAAIRALTPLLADNGVPAAVRAEARRTIGRHHAHLARSLLAQHDVGRARQHAWLGLLFAPRHRPAWRWAAAALVGRSL
jgi:Glycosyl transferase family 2